MKSYEDLLEEAYANVKEDRASLKSAIAQLEKEAVDDPSALLAVLKSKIFVADALTKVNAQLVELVKTEAKRSGKENPEDLNDDDRDSLFDQIATTDAETGEN